MSVRDQITAVILTYNEAPNIVRTLQSLQWARTVLIDSFSNDGTVELAKASHPNILVVQRTFDTHASQWNFAVDQVTTPWVLSLDADYELSIELIEELRRIQPNDNVLGYTADFEYRIYGHQLRASVYPSRIILFRRGCGSYYDDGHTQRLRIDGAVDKLAGRVFHDDRKDLHRWLRSQDQYMRLEARKLVAAPSAKLSFSDKVRKQIVIAPAAMFIYLLFVKGLIFDGWPGWFYVLQRTLAEALLSLRLLIDRYRLEDARVEGRESDGTAKD